MSESAMDPEAYVIGIDLGGTKVEACCLDTDRNVLGRQRVFNTPISEAAICGTAVGAAMLRW